MALSCTHISLAGIAYLRLLFRVYSYYTPKGCALRLPSKCPMEVASSPRGDSRLPAARAIARQKPMTIMEHIFHIFFTPAHQPRSPTPEKQLAGTGLCL